MWSQLIAAVGSWQQQSLNEVNINLLPRPLSAKDRVRSGYEILSDWYKRRHAGNLKKNSCHVYVEKIEILYNKLLWQSWFPKRAVEKLILKNRFLAFLSIYGSFLQLTVMLSLTHLQRNRHRFVRWISCMQMLEWFSSHSHV